MQLIHREFLFALFLLPSCSEQVIEMNPYQASLQNSVLLEMQPIKVADCENNFWIGKYEITWDQYMLFQAGGIDPVDGISGPTTPYVPMDFGMGVDNYPAISMTHYAARQFCRWLSNQTGHFYRLPTEKEWVLACGDAEGGWNYENSAEHYHHVGQLTPNQFGLYDMLGNVAEWVDDPPDSPSRAWGHSVLGGSWNDDPQDLHAHHSRQSKPNWQQQDPQIPRSIWYLTNAQTVGLRVVRPLIPPPQEQWNSYWDSSVAGIKKIHARQQRGER